MKRDPGELIVCGVRAVAAALANRAARRLFIADGGGGENPRRRQIRRQALAAGVPVAVLSKKAIADLAGGDNHQGVAARMAPPTIDFADLADLSRLPAAPRPQLIALDGVTDPRNLGAILRSARAFAVAAVIVPKRRSAPLTAAAAKAAAGAAAVVPVVRVVNLARALRQLRDGGWAIVGAASDGDFSLFSRPLPAPLCWALGDEEGGLRRLSRESCDIMARIPTAAGDAGCLNVSAACAVCLAAGALAPDDRPPPSNAPRG